MYHPYTQVSAPQKYEFSFALSDQVLDYLDFASNNLLVLVRTIDYCVS